MRIQLTTTWIKSMAVQCSLKSEHDFDWSHITNPSAFILTVNFDCTAYARCLCCVVLWHVSNAIFSIWSSFCLATRNHWTKRKYYLSITHTNTEMRLDFSFFQTILFLRFFSSLSTRIYLFIESSVGALQSDGIIQTHLVLVLCRFLLLFLIELYPVSCPNKNRLIIFVCCSYALLADWMDGSLSFTLLWFVCNWSWFVLFCFWLVFSTWLPAISIQQRAPDFFVCIRLWFNYIWLYSVYELCITQVTIVCSKRYISCCFRRPNNHRCIPFTFFLQFRRLCVCVFTDSFVHSLFIFWFEEFSIKTECVPKDRARYFMIRLACLFFGSLPRYGLLFILNIFHIGLSFNHKRKKKKNHLVKFKWTENTQTHHVASNQPLSPCFTW